MATKKTTKKKSPSTAKKTPASTSTAKKKTTPKATSTVAKTETKKADVEFDRIMEEMKKDAAREEAKKTEKKKKGGSGFWNALWILILVVVIGLISYWAYGSYQKKQVEKQLPELINYLGGGEMSLSEITRFELKSGVYEFDFIFEEYPEEPFTSYMTKDGKMFFVSGYPVEELLLEMEGYDPNAEAGGAEVSAASCETVNKSTEPELTAYIVADCPYGTQMQSVMLDAINQAPELAENFKVRYFFDQIEAGSREIDAMHGVEEAEEGLLQICLREEQPEVYWDYVGCYAGGSDSETCLGTASVNTANLNACMDDVSRGIAYAVEDNDLSTTHGVTGSPTLVLNNTETVRESDFGGRNADGLKSIVCCSADNAFGFCDSALSTEVAAANGDC